MKKIREKIREVKKDRETLLEMSNYINNNRTLKVPEPMIKFKKGIGR